MPAFEAAEAGSEDLELSQKTLGFSAAFGADKTILHALDPFPVMGDTFFGVFPEDPAREIPHPRGGTTYD